MVVGIDLTPPREIKKQKTQYVVGTSTKVSIFLFVLALAGGGFLFYTTRQLNSQINETEKQKAELTAKRASLKEVEDYAKRLSGKYFLLQKYLEGRTRYSVVVTELTARVPTGISIETIAFDSGGRPSKVTGLASDIVQVSAFISKLAKDGSASSESSAALVGKNAFDNVRLDSLLVNEDKHVEYGISFVVNEENFKK